MAALKNGGGREGSQAIVALTCTLRDETAYTPVADARGGEPRPSGSTPYDTTARQPWPPPGYPAPPTRNHAVLEVPS